MPKDRTIYTTGNVAINLVGMSDIHRYYETYCIYECLLEDTRSEHLSDDEIWLWAGNVYHQKLKVEDGEIENQIIDEVYGELYG